jgi:hypothetical protein
LGGLWFQAKPGKKVCETSSYVLVHACHFSCGRKHKMRMMVQASLGKSDTLSLKQPEQKGL